MTKNMNRLGLVVILLVKYIASQDLTSNDEYQYGRAIKCKRDDGTGQRCMPVFENVAYNQRVTANNTCGRVRQLYCVQTVTSGAKKICEECYYKIPGLMDCHEFHHAVSDTRRSLPADPGRY